jgi:hypothetical protein
MILFAAAVVGILVPPWSLIRSLYLSEFEVRSITTGMYCLVVVLVEPDLIDMVRHREILLTQHVLITWVPLHVNVLCSACYAGIMSLRRVSCPYIRYRLLISLCNEVKCFLFFLFKTFQTLCIAIFFTHLE